MNQISEFYRHTLAIFVGIFLFILIAFTMEKTGIPRGYALVLTAFSLAGIWAITGFSGATTTARKYFHAANSVRSTVNALAITVCLCFPLFLGDSGGVFFSNPVILVVVVIAIGLGMAVSAIIAARQFHGTGATDMAEFLTGRLGSTLAARCVAVIVGLSGLVIAAVAIGLIARITGWFFALSPETARVVTIGVVITSIILGGANSTTRLATISAALLLTALNLPLAINSVTYGDFPVGHLAFGNGALLDMWDLEDQLGSLQIPRLDEVLSPISPLYAWSSGKLISTGLVITGAVIFFPPVLQQYAVSINGEMASRSAGKTLLFFGFFGASLVALLAFSEFGLYQTVLGLTVTEARFAAPFLFSWGERSVDLVAVCGNVLTEQRQLLNACSEGSEHVLSIQDLEFDAGLLLAASPDLTALPFAYTALLCAALILTGVSFSAMIVLAAANTLVSAFLVSRKGTVSGSRIFSSRALSAILAIVAGTFVYNPDADAFLLFVLSMSLLASTVMPVMAGALHFPNVGTTTLVTAFGVGLAVAVLYFILSGVGIDFRADTGDELRFVLPGMAEPIAPQLSAIFAVPAAFVVLLLGSFLAERAASEPVGETGADE